MNEKVLHVATRFRVVQVEQEFPNGDRRPREIVRHPGSVVVVPVIDKHTVCLIRNRRVAVDKTLVELPAGTLETGEPPEVTARRELAEETGFRSSNMQRVLRFYASPGVLDEQMTLYVAEDLTPGPPAREEHEQIENLLVPWQDALAMIGDGRIEDAKTIIGLLYCSQLVDSR